MIVKGCFYSTCPTLTNFAFFCKESELANGRSNFIYDGFCLSDTVIFAKSQSIFKSLTLKFTLPQCVPIVGFPFPGGSSLQCLHLISRLVRPEHSSKLSFPYALSCGLCVAVIVNAALSIYVRNLLPDTALTCSDRAYSFEQFTKVVFSE